jgi:hypothetical protein
MERRVSQPKEAGRFFCPADLSCCGFWLRENSLGMSGITLLQNPVFLEKTGFSDPLATILYHGFGYLERAASGVYRKSVVKWDL